MGGNSIWFMIGKKDIPIRITGIKLVSFVIIYKFIIVYRGKKKDKFMYGVTLAMVILAMIIKIQVGI